MTHSPRQRRAGPLHSDRGAAFLLAVYMSAMVLLLLGGVSLQRTTTEVRAANVSRDLQQGFYLAEGRLDYALQVFRDNPLISDEDASKAITSLSGASAVVMTPSNAIQSDGSELRDVVLTGTRNGLTQRVYATLRISGDGTMPYREGIFGHGTAFIGTSGRNSGIMTLKGPVGTNSMGVGGLILANVDVQGPVWVGDAAVPQLPIDERFVGPSVVYGWPGNYAFYAGVHVDGLEGFGPHGSAIQTVNGRISGQPSVGAIPIPERSDLAAYDAIIQPQSSWEPSACSPSAGTEVQRGDLHLSTAQPYTVRDNDASQGLDLDPTPGKILLCVRSIVLSERSRLDFNAPATVYLTANIRPSYPEAPAYDPDWVTWTDGAYVQQAGAVVQASQDGEPLRNGVELVYPSWTSERFGQALIGVTGEFHGSIWAPGGWVFLADDTDVDFLNSRGPLDVAPVRTYAEIAWLYSDREPAPSFTMKAEAGDGALMPQDLNVSLVNWRLEQDAGADDEPLGSADPDNRAVIQGFGKASVQVSYDGGEYSAGL